MPHIRVQTQPIGDAASQAPTDLSGAHVCFSGLVRTNADQSLTHLVLEHFPHVTEAEIARIVGHAQARWPLQHVSVVHRVGPIAVGEEIVRVDTWSAHRQAAYEANAFIMDYLKTQAPFWKQECFSDGRALWVEPRHTDQLAQRQWSAPPPVRFQPRVGALVLAGGQGRRMGHVNKGLQPLSGLPLVQHVLQAIAPQVDAIVISANQDLAAYRQLGHPVLADLPQLQGHGPLAGIGSAQSALPAHIDAILTVPCDTPFLPPNLVATLAEALYASAAPAVWARTAEGDHPVVALLKPMLAMGLNAERLQQPESRGVLQWLRASGGVAVQFDDAPAFRNLNDPAALSLAAQHPLHTPAHD